MTPSCARAAAPTSLPEDSQESHKKCKMIGEAKKEKKIRSQTVRSGNKLGITLVFLATQYEDKMKRYIRCYKAHLKVPR